VELARRAQATDRQACTRLVSQALVAAAAMRGGDALVSTRSPVTLLERWNRDDGTSTCLVGEFEGAVVGVAAATRQGAPPRGLVECCYVEPGARGVGVGSALLEAAISWCRAQGCTELDALALPGDRTTKQRLEGAGFTARLLTLSRRLD
jgi:GNAT superfamily N-acetyltransferase